MLFHGGKPSRKENRYASSQHACEMRAPPEIARLRQRQGPPTAGAAKAHKGFFLAKTSPTMPAGTRSALAGAQHAPPAAARKQSIPRSMGQPQPPPQPAVSTQQAQEAQRVKVGQPTFLFVAQRKRSQICELPGAQNPLRICSAWHRSEMRGCVVSQMENSYSVKGSGGQTFEGDAGKVVSGGKPESSMDNPRLKNAIHAV